MTIKLTVMIITKIVRGRLEKPSPDFIWCAVWMVEMTRKKCGRMPKVCQMPEMAKNNNSGAKMQPRYKCKERNFCMAMNLPPKIANT